LFAFLPFPPIDETVVLYDLDGTRTHAIAEENEVCARPPRARDDQPVAIEEMRHLRGFLGAWIFLHALDVGKLAVARRVETERRELRQGSELHGFG